MGDKICIHCFYYEERKHSLLSIIFNPPGICYRFPERVVKKCIDWCGEFKEHSL